MIRIITIALLVSSGIVVAAEDVGAQDEPPEVGNLEPVVDLEEFDLPTDRIELATQATAVLKNRCYNCHGVNYEAPGLDINDRDSLVRSKLDQDPYITPGEPENSLLWRRLHIQGDMPPESVPVEKRPDRREIALVRAWIKSGAEFPPPNREFVPEEVTLKNILTHLRSLRLEDQEHVRYFTLTNIHNNLTVKDNDLRLYRAALVKLINSMSREADLVKPEIIDGDETDGLIFAVDLRDVGWPLDQWRSAIEGYPYGVSWNDPQLQRFTTSIEAEMGGALKYDGVPYIRADWFIRNASRPPAYHGLMGIPDTVEALETDQGVNFTEDFDRNRISRAGFAGSGVSRHNRLVDRHTGRTRYYYRSYDFGRSSGKGVIARFPLGPNFEDNKFKLFAFEHDGGEVIWNLPNGLQGYMLVDKEGKRIDDGPISIVRDLNEYSGSPVVVNGISCMGCHKEGIKSYTDTVRRFSPLGGDSLLKMQSLYPEPQAMDKLIARDKRIYQNAQAQVIGPYLQIGADENTPLDKFPEPITLVARWYDKDVSPDGVASELGIKLDEFQGLVRRNPKLRQLGLGPLEEGGSIPRSLWDTTEESSTSVFQGACEGLAMGSAVRLD